MKKLRILILIISLGTFLFASISLAADYKYVGSKSSDKYHYPNCKWAKKISPQNLIMFKTAQEALKAK